MPRFLLCKCSSGDLTREKSYNILHVVCSISILSSYKSNPCDKSYVSSSYPSLFTSSVFKIFLSFIPVEIPPPYGSSSSPSSSSSFSSSWWVVLPVDAVREMKIRKLAAVSHFLCYIPRAVQVLFFSPLLSCPRSPISPSLLSVPPTPLYHTFLRSPSSLFLYTVLVSLCSLILFICPRHVSLSLCCSHFLCYSHFPFYESSGHSCFP